MSSGDHSSMIKSRTVKKDRDRTLSRTLSVVEEQVEKLNKSGSVWNACLEGNLKLLQELVAQDPGLVRQRGSVGELPVHLCCLLRHHELMRWLIEFDSELALCQYEGEPYEGENLLHIAIVTKETDVAIYLAALYPELLRQKAVGRFFQRDEPLCLGGAATPCYYGEFALHFAAATNQPKLFDELMKIDARTVWLQDTNGNTVLHMCVIQEWPHTYDHICAHAAFDDGGSSLEGIKNSDGMVPIVLAADRGSACMLHHLFERSKQIQWQYGPVTCSCYPLENVDVIPGSPEGVLEKIVRRVPMCGEIAAA